MLRKPKNQRNKRNTNEKYYLTRLIPDSAAKFDIYLCFLNIKLIYETELNLKEFEDHDH